MICNPVWRADGVDGRGSEAREICGNRVVGEGVQDRKEGEKQAGGVRAKGEKGESGKGEEAY